MLQWESMADDCSIDFNCENTGVDWAIVSENNIMVSSDLLCSMAVSENISDICLGKIIGL